ncbi:MAG TPA: SpoIIE family protein phosphatase [Blastocatellia bacterium]|nr:SpoIIE family protein phosphatase [Blastocatellia bacterium]
MKNRHIIYIPLALLFVIAAIYQTRFIEGRITYIQGKLDRVRPPVVTGRYNSTIGYVAPEAERVGIHKGDQLIAVDGRPYTGPGYIWDRIYDSRQGDPITLTIRHQETEASAVEEIKQIEFARGEPEPYDFWGLLYMLVQVMAVPVICILLGFGVTLLRPRDPLAWLLLGLMLSFAQIIPGIDYTAWRGWARELMVGYKSFFQSAWPLWMVLVGIYFSERWSVDRRWPWLKWLVIIPTLLFAIKNTVFAVVSINNYPAVAPLYQALQPLQPVEIGLTMASVGIFFALLGYKSGTTADPDARRRMRLLYIGTNISLAPSLVIFVLSLVRGTTPDRAAPPWVVIPALAMFLLFPLTFAYVIVVHRALDIRVVIRQGVRYAFARGGVQLLRLILIGAIAFAMIRLIDRPNSFLGENLTVILLGVALIFAMRHVGEWLIGWTDRRFFREAYNTEQILSDLSRKVRTMVETKPLLETVADQISQSLHVPRVALLLKQDGHYRPAHALGYDDLAEVSFKEPSAVVEQLKQHHEPLRVYLDDADSWVYKTPGVDGEREMLKALDTQLLLPLAGKDALQGFISLGPKQSEEPFSGTDLNLLQSVTSQTALALENSQLTERIASEVAQRERLNRELEIAREVQERLFPQKLPSISGLDYCGACRPALGVGGDYYDFLLLPGDRLGIAIGDVSGKGIAAALLMASLQASLRSQAIAAATDLAEQMGNVNRLVYDASAENRYATFFYAQYDSTTRSLTYVNAGHNPPIIFRKAKGEWELTRLEAGGAVVGLLRNFPYSQATVTMEPGDALVAFTDGISEAMNPEEEEWGEDNLIEAVKECDGLTASDMLGRLVEAADRFAAGAKQHDDMTLLIVRVL